VTAGATVVHLVYPHREVPSCPDAIGWQLGQRLREQFDVRHYDWDARAVIPAQPGELLLGHAHPDPRTIFRRSLRTSKWARTVLLEPFNHDLAQVGFLHPIVPRVDLFLAITGRFWIDTLPSSPLAHWAPKLRGIDLAVDRAAFPILFDTARPPGLRRVVYIGGDPRCKNVGYLAEIAAHLPDVEFGWIGSGSTVLNGVRRHGHLDFSTRDGQEIVAQYDVLLTVGQADANPATILEAMSWGLVPVCTPESGYTGEPGILNVPLGDAARAAAVLRGLLDAPSEHFERLRRVNWERLEAHYNWDRFAHDVEQALEDDAHPPLGRPSVSSRSRLVWADARSRLRSYARAAVRH
jgi:glycosyltransferase involved in cell wall biosynthesis